MVAFIAAQDIEQRRFACVRAADESHLWQFVGQSWQWVVVLDDHADEDSTAAVRAAHARSSGSVRTLTSAKREAFDVVGDFLIDALVTKCSAGCKVVLACDFISLHGTNR